MKKMTEIKNEYKGLEKLIKKQKKLEKEEVQMQLNFYAEKAEASKNAESLASLN